jgi:hypothetical protein
MAAPVVVKTSATALKNKRRRTEEVWRIYYGHLKCV